ncbi:MAG: peptide-methionine (S)-S-oxide reductase MsrA [Chitinophagaceae bacterium]|mgnify:CR=1 FL=1|jgi:peptide-methionine (S)-S-oxide reductase|uniref:peptide-methionine (S)-S-oxide reductase MsrA n=1 Tax=Flavobacterium sp. TaxID=239 RepID=UPI0025BDAD45|nr:peptide-methionine (S)-S-oxide reductase MsrA [Flavobacterium sp.]MBA4155690.1 peptide-methionine (S)-S-oxide reductase [Flavobacterium sp.]MBY0482741.1 peptide-methionine (S)-S-oxide reductase MsrA [Chitinophagaceae bacterium]
MKNIQFATLGGGCFWGVEKFLQDTPGVIDAVSGYAGGSFIDPTYSDVCGGRTGHAEVVNVEFDADVISYSSLLEKFIPKYGKTSSSNLDSVSQYRSIVLYRNSEQEEATKKVFEKLEATSGKKVVTQVVALEKFYPAEDFHQDYHGSCRVAV